MGCTLYEVMKMVRTQAGDITREYGQPDGLVSNRLTIDFHKAFDMIGNSFTVLRHLYMRTVFGQPGGSWQ